MPSSTETATSSWADSWRDLGHLLRFRLATVRRPRLAVLGVAVVLALTAAFSLLPARVDPSGNDDLASMVATMTAAGTGSLGAALVAFLLLGIGSAVGSGGGRELLSRSEIAIHPVSPLTEHLGALLLSPLNVGWLVQAWAVLALTSLVTPTGHLGGALVVAALWIVVATAVAQACGWAVEGVRRTTRGVVVVRSAMAVLALAAGLLHLTGRLDDVVLALPTNRLAEATAVGDWVVPALLLVVLGVVAVLAGGRPAAWALGLPPREELRADSGVHEARPAPQPRWLDPELALLRRLDRGSVWRSVGMRRGLVVLGAGPGLVALVAGLSWTSAILLPGLATSGAALLFGVNAWSLDGRGMVWRETLPVPAGRVFDARVLVVGECLVAVSAVPIAMALLRNGPPPLLPALCLVSCWVVVVVQVLAISASWSVRSPYGVDLGSPRATPAPHAVMAGYAGRLSLVTTLTGVLFASITVLTWWWLPLALAAVFLGWSSVRLLLARRRWLSAPERARIVLTAAAV